MIKYVLYSCVLVFVLSACGSVKKGTDETPSVSKADYPYIQMFHDGLRLKTKGRTEEAIARFEQCLEMRQDDDAVYFALAKLEEQRGNIDQAAAYTIKAYDIDPGNTWYIQELAYLYYEQEDFENAVVNFAKLVEIEPNNIEWLYGYAEVLQLNNQPEEAINAITKAEEKIGKHPQFSLQRYQLYMDMKDTKNAELELLKAKEEYPKDANVIAFLVDHYFQEKRMEEGIAMLKELVKADPDNGRAHLALADVYQQQGDMERAFEEMRAAFNSSNLDAETKVSIMSSIHSSGIRIDDEVFGLLDILVEMHPESAGVWMVKGDYMLTEEDYEAAAEAYKNSIAIDPSDYKVWNQVLILEYQLEQTNALNEDSKECMELFPTMSLPYLLHGVSSNELGNHEEALESLTYGVELVSNSDRPLQAEFYGQIAEANFGTGAKAEGVKYYRKALDLDPSSLLLKNNFAAALAESKYELETALSLASQNVKEKPNNVFYRDTYGWVFFQMGKYKEAKEQFEIALNQGTSDPVVYEHMGDVMFKLGDVKNAVIHWEKAKVLGAPTPLLLKKIADKTYYDSMP